MNLFIENDLTTLSFLNFLTWRLQNGEIES